MPPFIAPLAVLAHFANVIQPSYSQSLPLQDIVGLDNLPIEVLARIFSYRNPPLATAMYATATM